MPQAGWASRNACGQICASRELDGAGRNLERVVVPLEDRRRRREDAEHGIRLTCGCQRDVEPADLGRACRTDCGARCARKHLRAEADAEHGNLCCEDLAQELLLALEPGEAIVLIRVHRAAEDHHRVVARGRIGRSAVGHRPPLERVPTRLDRLVEDAARNGRAVVDREHAHRVRL